MTILWNRERNCNGKSTLLEEKYPIEWNTDEALTACVINGDKELLRRANGNLITEYDYPLE